LDLDYMTLVILMGVFGVVGVTATATVSPNILASATCNCVPSPLARLQELSVTLLAVSLVLAPIGLTRRRAGGVGPAGGTGAAAGAIADQPGSDLTTGSGRVYTGPPMRSGELFALGMSLVVFGVGLVAVPAFLVLGNRLLIGEGAVVVALGLFLVYRGGRSK
jgi:hypothetical protein